MGGAGSTGAEEVQDSREYRGREFEVVVCILGWWEGIVGL
jgi:hypothetical protein